MHSGTLCSEPSVSVYPEVAACITMATRSTRRGLMTSSMEWCRRGAWGWARAGRMMIACRKLFASFTQGMTILSPRVLCYIILSPFSGKKGPGPEYEVCRAADSGRQGGGEDTVMFVFGHFLTRQDLFFFLIKALNVGAQDELCRQN